MAPQRLQLIESDMKSARVCFLMEGATDPQILHLEEESGVVTFEVQGWGDFTAFLPDPYPGKAVIYGPDEWEMEHCGNIADIVCVTVASFAGKCRVLPSIATERLSRDVWAGDDDSETSSTTAAEPFYCAPAGVAMEALLAEHIQSARNLLGAGSVEVADLADSWRVRLLVSVYALPGLQGERATGERLLSSATAQAWGLDPELPMSIVLRLPKQGYLTCGVRCNFISAIGQEGCERFGPEKQLVHILSDFGQRHNGLPDVKRPRTDSLSGSETVERYRRKKVSMMSAAQADGSLGFLAHLALYAQLRITTLHEYCALCDEPFTYPSMLLPTVCCRAFCAYRFCEFGERLTSASGVHTQPELEELLVFMLAAACKSSRRHLVLDPFPCVYDEGRNAVLDPSNKDCAKLQATLDELVAVRAEVGSAEGAAWTRCKAKMSPGAYGLLQWVRGSNRSLLLPLPPEHRIQAIGTEFQYLLISAPPEKEEKFQALRRQHGSFFAFHGSHVGNWHSILRNGLKNASGTALMSAGQAHGPGIYLGRASSISMGYSQMNRVPAAAAAPTGTPLRELGNRLIQHSEHTTLLALCEVVDHPSVKRFDWGFVAPEEDKVSTRFFLLYEDGRGGDVQLTGPVVTEIRSCMSKVAGEGSAE